MSARTDKTDLIMTAAFKPDTDNCILWRWGTRGYYGHGTIKIKGRTQAVGRLVCTLAYGAATADDITAAHTCDTPRCLNSRHLRWKAHSENTRESNKLTADQVAALISRYGVGKRCGGPVTQEEVGAEFGISQSYAGDIIRGKYRPARTTQAQREAAAGDE